MRHDVQRMLTIFQVFCSRMLDFSPLMHRVCVMSWMLFLPAGSPDLIYCFAAVKMGCGKARGLRRNTRDLFQRRFGQNGMPAMSTYLITYKLGDYVDIVANGAIHKGMPYRYYHGRTGRIWNITKSAVGVMVNKRVGGKILNKRLHVRIEHVKPSRCVEDFKKRVAANEKAKVEAKRTGSK